MPEIRHILISTFDNFQERIVTKCLENRVALYSPHTAFDAVQDGVNDWLISPFGNGKMQPLEQCFETNQEMMVSFNADEQIKVPFEKTIQGNSISFVCGQNDANQLALPKSAKIVKLEKKTLPSTGPGRLLTMDKSLTLGQALEKVKDHLGLPHLRIAIAVDGSLDSEIKSIGVCAGSGASVLAGCQANLWITGEMSHHEVLDAVHAGTSVILCEHSNTERGYLKLFAKRLTGMLDNHVKVVVSEKDTDPLKIM
jgi:dinuclear metal center YbgI/SA1388 family protein